MENQDQVVKLQNEIDAMQRKVEHLERVVHEKQKFNGSSVWVLVPVAAIVMWGLTQIFN